MNLRGSGGCSSHNFHKKITKIMENKQENTDFVNGLLSPELQEGLKDIKPTTEDFEDLDFVTYKYYNAE